MEEQAERDREMMRQKTAHSDGRAPPIVTQPVRSTEIPEITDFSTERSILVE
jgi:hypothetical protein